MEFRTEIYIPQSLLRVEHHQNVITFGSCFAYNISAYLAQYRFQVSANPFGVLYNPVSILSAVNILRENKHFNKEDLLYNQDEWHSFYHHSDFSHHDANLCLNKINSKIDDTVEFIRRADVVIITYGTSFVYKYLKNDKIVSNCHKLPDREFERFRLTIDKSYQTIKDTVDELKMINPGVKIIFTISPVRHWKDGAVENQRSKAILLLSVEKIVKERKEDCFYFPSYELLLDDLRDYRFYESDLLHPNKPATDYIWQKFTETFFTSNCLNSMAEIDRLNKARHHKVRNPDSEQAQKFFHSQLKKIETMQNKYPFLDIKSDYNYFLKLIKE